MIIQCPACAQGYDITTYPADARFACSRCDHVVQADATSESSELLAAPPLVEAPEQEFDNSTRKLAPVKVPAASSTHDLAEPPEEKTMVVSGTQSASSIPASDVALPVAQDSPSADSENAVDDHTLHQMAEEGASESLDDFDFDLHQPPPGVEFTVRTKSPLLGQPTSASPGEAAAHNVIVDQADQVISPARAALPVAPPDLGDEDLHSSNGAAYEATAIATQLELEQAANRDPIETLASDPDEFDIEAMLIEGSKEEAESTAVGINPLLNAQAYLDDLQDDGFHDPLAQDESTRVGVNPMLAKPNDDVEWSTSSIDVSQPNQTPYAGAYSPTQPQPGHPEIDEAAQTSFELPRITSTPPPGMAAHGHLQTGPAVPMPAPAPTPVPASGVKPAPQVASVPTDAHKPSSSTQPSSWDSLDASHDPLDDGGLLVPQTDGRAIVGMALLITFVLGPICLLLGWSAFQRIRAKDSVFRGKGLAMIAMVGGAMETLALGALLVLFLLFPQGHPALAMVVKTLHSLQSESPRPDYTTMAAQPARLDQARVQPMMREALHDLSMDKAGLRHVYVYQEPGKAHAFVHWRHPLLKRNQRSLFLYSNRKHWHIALLYAGKGFEVRATQSGGATLTTATARTLIRSFWKVRGKFSGTRIAQLYVVQKPGQHIAHAYWKLTKQVQNKPIRQWKVKSLFHRSNSGQWYISRYGIRVPKDELFALEKPGPTTLSLALAKTMLTEHHKDNQKPFAPTAMFTHQQKNARSAHVHWRSGRKNYRSLLRYTNAGKWLLARLNVIPPMLMSYHEEGTAQLEHPLVQKLVTRYMRRHMRQLLTKTFAKQGKKGKPPTRLPHIKKLYLYQPTPHHAYARWQATFSGSFMFVESELHRSAEGHWYLSRFRTKRDFDVRFAQTKPGPMTPTIAKDLIQQYWRSDVRSEKFTGARIEALYLYKETLPATPRLLWAHWRKQQSGQTTGMRTLFFRSNKGRWYLGTYDLGLGYLLSPHAAGDTRLNATLAATLLRKHLKSKPRYKRATLSEVYVSQETNTQHAYVGWRLKADDKTKIRLMNSLFHHAADGHWYLSILSAPHQVARPSR